MKGPVFYTRSVENLQECVFEKDIHFVSRKRGHPLINFRGKTVYEVSQFLNLQRVLNNFHASLLKNPEKVRYLRDDPAAFGREFEYAVKLAATRVVSGRLDSCLQKFKERLDRPKVSLLQPAPAVASTDSQNKVESFEAPSLPDNSAEGSFVLVPTVIYRPMVLKGVVPTTVSLAEIAAAYPDVRVVLTCPSQAPSDSSTE